MSATNKRVFRGAGCPTELSERVNSDWDGEGEVAASVHGEEGEGIEGGSSLPLQRSRLAVGRLHFCSCEFCA